MFNPIKETNSVGEEQQAIVWCSENVQIAKEAIDRGKPLKANPFFENNTELRRYKLVFEYSPDEEIEMANCMIDIEYFSNTYVKLETTDEHGFPTRSHVKLYPHQRKILLEMHHAFVTKQWDRFILLWSRQASKTTTTAIFMSWLLCFQSNFSIAVIANKSATSTEVITKVKEIFKALPFYMKSGVGTWNEGGFSLDNGSKIRAYPCTKDAVNGRSIHLLYIDEFAFTYDGDTEKQRELLSQAQPALAKTKGMLIISSTPNGNDLFCELYDKALKGENSYRHSFVPWWMIPDRDEEWRRKMIAEITLAKFLVQYELSFDVEVDRLLSPKTMRVLDRYSVEFKPMEYGIEPFDDIESREGFRCPKGARIRFGNDFFLQTTDLSEGLGEDSTVMQYFRLRHKLTPKGVALIWLEQAFLFEHNEKGLREVAKRCAQTIMAIDEEKFRTIVEQNNYGETFFLHMENLDNSDADDEYHLEFSQSVIMRFRRSMANKRRYKGLRLNKLIKRIGVAAFKKAMESGAIVIRDNRTVEQIKYFQKDKRGNYKATVGHDDLVMPVVNMCYALSLNGIEWQNFVDEYLDYNGVDCDTWRFMADLSDIAKRAEYDDMD